MAAPTAEVTARARRILEAMEADVRLVPERMAKWWIDYLHYHRDRYVESLAFVGDARGAILEIGSVPGQLTLLLQELGHDVRGVDLAPERVSEFLDKRGLRVDKVDIETDRLPFADGSFGTVLFMEVMEHLRINPLHTFREMARVLEPGGRIIVSTPNVTPGHRLGFLLGKAYQGDIVVEFRKLEQIGHMGHFRLYTLPEIRAFLTEVGLELRSATYEGEYIVPTWKHKLFWLLHPNKSHFRSYTYVVAGKPGGAAAGGTA